MFSYTMIWSSSTYLRKNQTERAGFIVLFLKDISDMRPVRLAYQPPASSTFLSQQISHQQPANSTFLSEQTSTTSATSQTNRLMIVTCFRNATS
jgi:hypothetical protein